jgi:hypothetical protein
MVSYLAAYWYVLLSIDEMLRVILPGTQRLYYTCRTDA